MKWVYQTEFFAFEHSNMSDIVRRLNVLGDEGWELVGTLAASQFGGTFFFKRLKDESQS